MGRVYVVGTADTKGEELAFLAGAIADAGASVTVVDVGTRPSAVPVDVAAANVAGFHPEGAEPCWSATTAARPWPPWAMPSGASSRAGTTSAGVIGIGGGGGTSIVTAGMRSLPLGLPKIMVSTLASGDVAPYVGVSDIVMMPSMTDMAGLNRIQPRRPAQRRAGDRRHGGAPAPAAAGKPALGLTMFGVTTPCVTAIAEALRADYDCLVFHATGTGGRTMEKLADSGLLAGVIDITTTEVCDLLFGGVLAATEDRFGAIARTGIPYVGSVGALDMVNFWAPETVPESFRGPPALPPQSQCHADAHDGRGMPSDRRLDRRAPQSPARVRCASSSRRKAFRRSTRRRRLRRSRRRPRPLRGDRGDAEAGRQPQGPASAAAHQRSCLRRGRRRGLPRHRPLRGARMPSIPRQEILEKFRRMIAEGIPIVGGGAGTGLSAKAEEAGGIDLIIIYNSGRYRMAGRGSAAGLLAYGNANEIVREMAVEVLPVVRHTPVLAGVNGTDPFVLMPRFLAELKEMGFSGVQNFPTIGLFDGEMRQSFEETGMGFALEVDMIAAAHALDLLTTPYVFNPDEARAMTEAGADIVVAHMGVTTGGSIGATCGQVARRLRRRDRRHRRRSARGAQRRDPALPWRADLHARGRPLHPRARQGLQRLLRRELDGAAAGRDRHPRPDGRLQVAAHRKENREAMTAERNFVYPKDVDTFAFDWGRLALTVAPERQRRQPLLRRRRRPRSGQGHARHNHPGAEEIIFVISGEGEQMVEDPDGQAGGAEGRAGLHHLRAGKPLPFDDQHRQRADAALRRLFAGRPGTALRELPDFRLVPAGS